MYCSRCGNKLDERTGICPVCGQYHVIVPTPVYAPPAPVPPKKVSGLAITSLILSAAALALALFGFLGAAIGGITALVLVMILGLLLFIPALIVSLIAFFTGLKRFKQTHQKPDLVIRSISAGLTTIPLLLVLVFLVFKNPIAYNNAMDAYENGDYLSAYETFELLGDYSDSAEMAQHAKKALIISELEGSWKSREASANSFIRIQFDGKKFNTDVILGGEIFAPDSFSGSGTIEISDRKITLYLNEETVYLYFTYTLEDGTLELVDKDGVKWKKYE